MSQMEARHRYEFRYPGFTAIVVAILSQLEFLAAIEYKTFCILDKSWENLNTFNCSHLNPQGIFTITSLGDNATIPVDVMYLGPLEPQVYISIDLLATPFSLFTTVKKMIITRNAILNRTHGGHSYQVSYLLDNRESLEAKFQSSSSLEYLEISHSYFRAVQFVLPDHLKAYNISGNEYITLNIHGSSELDDLTANGNKDLKNVPYFHDPSMPPITKLRLKGCALPDMTVVDLAPLCFLELLELQFPPGNRFTDRRGYCNCTMLKIWANESKFIIDTLECYEPKPGEKMEECPTKEYLGKARQIQENCPLLKTGGALSNTLYTIMKYTFFFILLMLLVGTLILYVVRHFHLREWLREHHLTLSRASPALSIMEEGEGSPQGSKSRSESGSGSGSGSGTALEEN